MGKAGTWAGLRKGGSGEGFRGLGCCFQEGTGLGTGEVLSPAFPSLYSTAEKLRQCWCLLWWLNGDPLPSTPRG